jgi:radical SAM superfamily enzyme YgiQ (UPF0313 family)
MALLLQTPALLKELLCHHTPGSMKIAPEHSVEEILKLMHKESHQLLQDFMKECQRLTSKRALQLSYTPYIISSHPGSTKQHAQKLVKDLRKLGLTVRKFQDFTPTPGTLSTAMFVTGLHPKTKKKIQVARNQAERAEQRKIIEKGFGINRGKSGKTFGRKKKKRD